MKLSNRSIFLFWAPLAATWLMMAAEGPFLAAVIARLADPKFNLAAHGVAFAFAILIEAPVIMLMSAATALVEDRTSYKKLRNFANVLNAGSTVALLVLLVPAVYGPLVEGVLGLPEVVADIGYGALWFYLPWPAAIGIRRFLQGVLIRSGRTRLVAIGTVVRLIAMAGTALILAVWTGMPGAWIGSASLAMGVIVEALVSRWMARGAIRELLETPCPPGGASELLTYRGISRFYTPLALTSLIGLAVQPLLTFFMGRAASPIESLAVFPVVNSLAFVFRALGLSFQDASIALIGRRREHYAELSRFTTLLGLGSMAGLGAIAFTPLAGVWFETISGLSPDLAAFAYVPARLAVPVAGLSVLLSFQRSVLMQARTTRPITVATALEVAVIGFAFVIGGWWLGLIGVTAAFVAFVAGRIVSTTFLVMAARRIRRNPIAR
jgi:O-antigen/teichoic acid export membrane protein